MPQTYRYLLLVLWTMLVGGLSAQTARLQVIHNSPDALAQEVDVYVNGSLLLDNFAFRTATPFVDVPAEVDLNIGVAPGNSAGPDDIIATFTVNLADGESYIAMATGLLDAGSYDPFQPFTLNVFSGAREAATDPGNTDMLVYHGSTDAPTVDVVETEVTMGATLVDNLFYGDFAGYLEVPTDDYVLEIRDAGGMTTLKTYDAPLATLGLDGAALTVVASGFVDPAANNNGPAFGLFVALPAGGALIPLPELLTAARVQVIHNAADALADTVDIYINDALAIDNFAFRTATPYLELPAGVDLTVGVAPGNSASADDVIAEFTYNLVGGRAYQLIATGLLDPSNYEPFQPFTIDVYPDAREFGMAGGSVDVLVYHGATDAPPVDVIETAVTGGATILNDLAYGEFAGYLSLPVADYRLQVRDSSGMTALKSYEVPLATLGLDSAALTVIASGFLDPAANNNGAPFGLFVALPSGGDLLPLPESSARVQVIHNSSDALADTVDVYINDVLAIDNFAFRTATPYLDVPAELPVTVGIAPANSASANDILLSYDYTLVQGRTYQLIASGLLDNANYSPFQPFGIAVYPNAREAGTTGGFTDVLVYHGSTDAPAVDVVETAVTGGATIINDMAYGEFAGYSSLPTDNYRLEVRDETGTVTVASYEVPLADLGLDSAALTVVASGFLDPSSNNQGAGFDLYAVFPNGDMIALPRSTARIQVIHNAPDALAAEVDVYLNGQLAIDNFAFRSATPYIDVPAVTDLVVGIAPADSEGPEDVIAEFTYNLVPERSYQVIATGLLDAGSYSPFQPFDLAVYPASRESADDPANVDVLVYHGSTDAPAVDIVETAVTGGLTIIEDMAYGEFAGYLELQTADYRLEVRDETGTVTVASYEVPLASLGLGGNALTVIASGFLDPLANNNGDAFGLFAVLANGQVVALPNSTARIQVLHNSPDAAAASVDVYLNGARVLDDFAFRTATPFIDVPAVLPIQVGIAPGNSASADDIIATFEYTLIPDRRYQLIATGVLDAGSYDPFQPFDIAVYPMARESASNTGNVDVLVYHGATDAPAVDVVETAVTGGVTIINDLAYGEFAGYLELAAADYQLDVRDETGTVTVATYLAPLGSLGLEGQALSVVASGFLDPSVNNDGPGFGLFAVLPAGGPFLALPSPPATARVQVIHNSPDQLAGAVDVYLDDQLLIDNFAFRTATPFVDVPAGVNISLGVAPPNSTSAADILTAFDVILEPGETYIVVADGLVTPFGYDPFVAFSLEVYPSGRESAAQAGFTDVLVHHGSTDAPTVDVVETSVTGGVTIVDDLSYASFAGYLELPTLDYTLDVRDATGTTTVQSYGAPLATLGLDGAALVVVASGFLNPAANLNGPAFGLYAALPTGGALIPLPLVTTSTDGLPEGASISFFPNPATDILMLQLENLDVRQVRLHDLSGREIPVRYTQGGDTIRIPVSGLPTGTYVMTVSGEDFTVREKIFIVE